MHRWKLGLLVVTLSALLPLSASADVRLAEPNTSALTSGLVGYWSMDGNTVNWTTYTIADESGLQHTATIQTIGLSTPVSTSTAPIAGRIGQALTFRGGSASGDNLSIGINTAYSIGSTATFSAWIKISSFPSGAARMGIVSDRQGGVGINFDVSGTDACGQGKLEILEGGSGATCGTTTLALNKWYHAVAVLNGTSRLLYVNGMLDSSTSGTWSWPSGGATVASANGNSNYFFSGAMDDVRIYNRALSTQEIGLLYALGTIHAGNTPAVNSSFSIAQGGLNSGLISYWPLDGNTTNWTTGMTADVSGNGVNGALVGMSATSSPVPGKIGGALKFNGSNSYVNLTNSFTSPNLTISLWFKTTSAGEALFGQSSSIPPSTASSFVPALAITPTGLLRGEFWTGVTGSINSTGSVSDGKWHYAVLVGNTSVQYMYLDGSLVGSRSGTISQGWWAFSQIGTAYDSESRGICPIWCYFNGTIDDVRVYSRALSAQEINDLYTAGGVNIDHSNTTSNIGINSGLIGYWTFDGPTTNWRTDMESDSSGNNLAASLVSLSTSTSPTPGKIGQALKFNGTSSYLSIGSVPALANYTISFWAKPSNCGTTGEIQFFDSPGDNIGVSCKTGGVIANWAGGSSYPISGSGVWSNGQWIYITVTSQGSTNKLYINGSLNTTGTAGNGFTSGTAYVGQVTGGGRYYGGTIDDFRIYNRALSAQEVQQLYQMAR